MGLTLSGILLSTPVLITLFDHSGDADRLHPKSEPYKPSKNQEAVRTSKLPAGHPDALLDPIERDDWPGPPCPAAAFPELCKCLNQCLSQWSKQECLLYGWPSAP